MTEFSSDSIRGDMLVADVMHRWPGTTAYADRLPMMLKGPTGCGKTRFIEHMAWRLGRPLVTVACHEDMTASDLVGRYLLDAQGTVWHDGPLTSAGSPPDTPAAPKTSSPPSVSPQPSATGFEARG